MNATCPHCGAVLSEGPGTHCPACAVRLPGPRELPARPLGEDAGGEPPVTRPLAPPVPKFPAWMLLVASPVACGWYGNLIGAHGNFAAPPNPVAILGGLLGLVLGLLLWLDDRALRRHIRERWEDAAAEAEPVPALLRPPSEGLATLMLIVPLVTGAVIWQRQALNLSAQVITALSCATVLGTALLGYADLRRWAFYYAESREGEEPPLNPTGMYVSMLILWVLAFPAYFAARRRLGAKNLLAPALAATAAFLAPSVAVWFTGPDLPGATAPEVLATVKKAIESMPQYLARWNEFGPLTLSDAEEISFDAEKQRREGRAKITTKRGEQIISYTVEWQDRKKSMFQIRTGIIPWFAEPELPGAAAPEVLATVKKVFEGTPQYQARKNELGPLTLSDPEEISFDPQAQRRVVRAKLTSNLGEEVIFYTVEWQDRQRKMFQVRISDR